MLSAVCRRLIRDVLKAFISLFMANLGATKTIAVAELTRLY